MCTPIGTLISYLFWPLSDAPVVTLLSNSVEPTIKIVLLYKPLNCVWVFPLNFAHVFGSVNCAPASIHYFYLSFNRVRQLFSFLNTKVLDGWIVYLNCDLNCLLLLIPYLRSLLGPRFAYSSVPYWPVLVAYVQYKLHQLRTVTTFIATCKLLLGTYPKSTLWPAGGTPFKSTFKTGLLHAVWTVLTASMAAQTDWLALYWVPTLTHCKPPLTICSWFITWTSNSILIVVSLSDEALVTEPKSKNAMSIKPSPADDVMLVALLVKVSCLLTSAIFASVSRRMAVPLNGSLILVFSSVDSGMVIVSEYLTRRPTNCQSADLVRLNLYSEAC